MKIIDMTDGNIDCKVIGSALILASIQSSIGSVEMSSKFSVNNFSKDQRTLQAAADALSSYIIIGLIWTIGATFVLYGEFGIKGLIYSLITNFVMMAWIVISYMNVFADVAKNNNLKVPSVMFFS